MFETFLNLEIKNKYIKICDNSKNILTRP